MSFSQVVSANAKRHKQQLDTVVTTYLPSWRSNSASTVVEPSRVGIQ